MNPPSAPAALATAALRPVYCVIDHLHRDLAVADAARAGRFTHGGTTLELGRRPDWIGGGLAHDEEWRIEWVKLYEGLDLAHAFAVTGDVDHLAAWEDLVESFCDQVPVGMDDPEVSARRVQNWLYAWQRFRAAPGFDGLRPGLERRLIARLAAEVAHLAGHLTPERNHRTLELYTLLLIAVALADDDGAHRALELLADNAERDVWADGVHRECSADYHCLVLRSLLGAIANARAVGLAVPAGLLEGCERACRFALHLQRPDGITPALSDGDEGHFGELLLLGADLLGRDDLRWAATSGRAGRPPATRHATFRTGGYVVQRSGWGERGAYRQERWAIFDVGPLGDGGHGHYDQLAVELYGAGSPLVVDPGHYTYAEQPEGWRHHFKGTAAHNTVTVDELDQVPYRRGKPKGPLPQARLVSRSTRPGLDVAIGEATSPCHDATHTRTVRFVDEDHWVIHDELDAPTAHRYACRWHLPAAAWQATELRAGAEGIVVVRAPMVELEIALGGNAASLPPVDVTIEAGWVSPHYGVKHRAPVVVLRAEGHHARFRTTIRPRRHQTPAPPAAPAGPTGPAGGGA